MALISKIQLFFFLIIELSKNIYKTLGPNPLFILLFCTYTKGANFLWDAILVLLGEQNISVYVNIGFRLPYVFICLYVY